MKDFIIDAVLKEAAYDYLDQYRPAVLKEIEQKKSPEEIYIDLCLHGTHVPNEVEKILEGFEAEKKVPPGFARKFYEAGKYYRDRPRLIAKVDNFEVYDLYKVSEVDFAIRPKIIAMLKEAVALIKSKGYGFLIYGIVNLTNPILGRAIATYNRFSDEIELKLFRGDNLHAVKSMIHELAHRMWYKLMNNKDREKWEDEFTNKLGGRSQKQLAGDFLGKRFYKTVKFEEFPTLQSQDSPEEYFAGATEVFIVDNKKYSDLLDEIY